MVELVEKIKKALCLLIIDNGEKVVSCGSSVLINENGRIITAKHVIANRANKFYQGRHIVQVPGLDKPQVYIPKTPADFAINLNIPQFFKSLPVDLAILEPENELDTPDFINISETLAPAGTEVIIGGFPDDFRMAFDFISYLNRQNPDMTKMLEEYEKKFKYYMRSLFFKKAMIGNKQTINLEEPNPFDEKIQMAQYWIDSDLSYGGSGGPIVDLDGNLLGIVTNKALTDAKEFKIQRSLRESSENEVVKKIPSGNGIGLSTEIITKWYDMYYA